MKFKLGTCYVVRFLDHACGIDSAMEIDIVGWCIKITDKYTVFSPWRVDNDDEDIVSGNYEPITIVNSCILKKRAVYIPKFERSKHEE